MKVYQLRFVLWTKHQGTVIAVETSENKTEVFRAENDANVLKETMVILERAVTSTMHRTQILSLICTNPV